MEQVYDLIILGSGPAGLSAGIYAARAELAMAVIEKAPMSGGQIINTYEVDNYPGIPGVSGFDLAMKFREHCDKLEVNFIEGEVIKFNLDENLKVVVLDNGDIYHAKAVIVATGAISRKLGVPGEAEFSGAGVSYCATCDGAFFRGKTVAVVGGGDVAVEDAIFLARICKQVYVIHRRDEFRAAKSLSNQLLALNNVTVVWDTTVSEIIGSGKVSGLKLLHVKENKESELPVDGVFIAVGNKPNSEIMNGLVALDAGNYLIADESGKTSVPGIFAAGDVRSKTLRQVITAAADGANAVTSVERYLNELL